MKAMRMQAGLALSLLLLLAAPALAAPLQPLWVLWVAQEELDGPEVCMDMAPTGLPPVCIQPTRLVWRVIRTWPVARPCRLNAAHRNRITGGEPWARCLRQGIRP